MCFQYGCAFAVEIAGVGFAFWAWVATLALSVGLCAFLIRVVSGLALFLVGGLFETKRSDDGCWDLPASDVAGKAGKRGEGDGVAWWDLCKLLRCCCKCENFCGAVRDLPQDFRRISPCVVVYAGVFASC